MSDNEGRPGFDDVLRARFRDYLADLHGPLVCRVVSFDQGSQTVDVQPVIKIRTPGAGLVDAPILRGIAFGFPQGGQCSDTWPLSPGDYVDVVPQGYDMSGWEAGAGDGEAPPTPQRWGLGGVAVATLSRPSSGLSSDCFVAGGRKIKAPLVEIEALTSLVMKCAVSKLGSATAAEALVKGTSMKGGLDALFTSWLAALGALKGVSDSITPASYPAEPGAVALAIGVSTFCVAMTTCIGVIAALTASWLSLKHSLDS